MSESEYSDSEKGGARDSYSEKGGARDSYSEKGGARDFDSEISDTASHFGEEEYEDDGFVVHSDEESEPEVEKDDEETFLKELQDNYSSIVTKRELRPRRSKKTASQIYEEYAEELVECRTALNELKADIKACKRSDKTTLRSLQEEEEAVMDHMKLLQEKMNDLEEAERTVFGDLEKWEDQLSKAKHQWPVVEKTMIKAQESFDTAKTADKKRIAELELEKAEKKRNALKTRIVNLEKKINVSNAEREFIDNSSESEDFSPKRTRHEEDYVPSGSESDESSDYQDDLSSEDDYDSEDDYSDE